MRSLGVWWCLDVRIRRQRARLRDISEGTKSSRAGCGLREGLTHCPQDHGQSCVSLHLDKLSLHSSGPWALHEVPGRGLLHHALLCAGEGKGGAKPKKPHPASGPEAKLPCSCCRTSSDTCRSADTLQTARDNKEPISRRLPEILLQICCAVVLTSRTPWLLSTSLSALAGGKGMPQMLPSLPLPSVSLSPANGTS